VGPYVFEIVAKFIKVPEILYGMGISTLLFNYTHQIINLLYNTFVIIVFIIQFV